MEPVKLRVFFLGGGSFGFTLGYLLRELEKWVLPGWASTVLVRVPTVTSWLFLSSVGKDINA